MAQEHRCHFRSTFTHGSRRHKALDATCYHVQQGLEAMHTIDILLLIRTCTTLGLIEGKGKKKKRRKMGKLQESQ